MKGGMKVEYKGGESRQNPGMAVDYMLVQVGCHEFYAELPATEDETGNYEALKSEIEAQARYWGINPDFFEFYYD